MTKFFLSPFGAVAAFAYDVRMWRHSFIHHGLVTISIVGGVTVLACGPFFPETALEAPRGILQPPLFHFQSELNNLPLPDGISKHKPGTPAYTLDLEMEEMVEIMASHPNREAWVKSYRQLRCSMIYAGDDSEQKMQQVDSDAAVGWDKAKRGFAEVIAPLPEDVRLYLEGAAARLEGRDASPLWQRLLALPAEKRRWRSTWAAWMLFRTAPHEEQGRRLAETRRLRSAGFKDCLHLGIEATYILGRPASDYAERTQVTPAEWKRAAMLRALLGLNRATDNLRHDRRLLNEWSEDFAREVVADDLLRRVQMLHLIESAETAIGWESGFQSGRVENGDLPRWLETFEKAGITDQKEAVLLAWFTYNAANFAAARRWLALAPQDDVNALSLRGKLAAMRGDRRESERLLTRLAAKLPTPTKEAHDAWSRDQNFEWFPLTTANYADVRVHKMLADCGVAQIARNDFAGALQTFLRTDYWRDAAYIAERLLSVEELLALSRSGKLPRLQKLIVADTEPSPSPMTIAFLDQKYGDWYRPESLDRFTYLIARRLAREGFINDACRLLPADLAMALTRFDTERRRADNRHVPEGERGASLWLAAQLQRRLGMELFGFETGPDHAFCAGAFELDDLPLQRSRSTWQSRWVDPPKQPNDIARYTPVLPATNDELWCSRRYGPRIKERFHYRYTAADLAWKAAALLPDDDEQTALILATAGNWLKNRDPKAADRFYKALVHRNPSIPLAQQADEKHWLPSSVWNFDLELE